MMHNPDDDEHMIRQEANEPLAHAPIRKPKRTPLPKFQIFIVFLIQLSEPVTATVIYPFINQFVRDTGVTGGDERKTGHYAGVIESIFFFTEALTVFQWGWASDRLGRKPILLLGPFGLCFAMLGFGLSKNFWALVASRCLQGVFNGNIGVSRSVIAEITDSTNIADAFAMSPLMWGSGVTVGPILGGVLSEPAKNWPALFGGISFFRDYPYFLPCAAAGLVALASGLIASIGLKETLPSVVSRQKIKKAQAAAKAAELDPSSTTRLLGSEHSACYGSSGVAPGLEIVETGVPQPAGSDTDAPPPFSALLIPQVLIPLSVYMFLAFIDMSSQVLRPLVYSTSISLGGLGFDPYRIGMIMGIWGVTNVIFQLFFLARAIRRFGPRTMLITGMASYIASLGLYPLLSFFVRSSGRVDAKVWAVIISQLIFQMANYVAWAAGQIIILDSAPNRASLGATGGMSQALASAMRSIAPTAASSLFSVSLERRLAGGNMVFIILVVIGLIGIRLAFFLPKHSKSRDH